MTIFQLMCTDNQLACAQKHIIDSSIHLKCLMPCEGIFADVKRLPPKNITNENTKLFFENYESYKRFFEISEGKVIILFRFRQWFNMWCLAPPVASNLKYVRIYFDTPTFDRITKDRAAKFVDMLSAIGGTMGLLTGFSIISGVEILYFAAKIIYGMFKEKKIENVK